MAHLQAPPTTESPARSRPPDAPAGGPAVAILRIVAGALVIATGAIHLYLYQDGFSGVATIGRLFLANFVAALVLGPAILARPRAIWCLLGAGFCLATLGGFLVSVHWGLFDYQETLRGAWQVRAAVVEVAGAIACVSLGVLSRSVGD